MGQQILKINRVNIYIRKASGQTHRKNREGNFQPVLYKAMANEEEPLCLATYTNIKKMDIRDALDELIECGVILCGNTLDIQFFDKESVDRFEDILNREKVCIS